MSSQSASPAARLVRSVFHGRNPLTRTGDRVESAVALVALVIALLGVPIAATLGSEVHARESVTSVQQLGARHQTTATLLEDSPPGVATAGITADVQAVWRAPDGTPHRGVVAAFHDLKAGSEVPVWIDEHGALTTPPLTSEGAVITAVGSAALTWLGLVLVLCVTHLLVVHAIRRRHLALWERDWAVVEPEWTRRRR